MVRETGVPIVESGDQLYRQRNWDLNPLVPESQVGQKKENPSVFNSSLAQALYAASLQMVMGLDYNKLWWGKKLWATCLPELKSNWWKGQVLLPNFGWSKKYRSAAGEHRHETRGRTKCSMEGSVHGSPNHQGKGRSEWLKLLGNLEGFGLGP